MKKLTEAGTKQQILEAALELFSQYGFSAVSIRDICGKVGIKCSSVYYHFRNKQAILDELTGRFLRLSESMPGPAPEAADSIWPATADGLACATRSYFNRYFLDGEMLKFQKAMSIEQHCNAEIAGLYRSLVFDRPLAFHARLLGAAVRRGLLRDLPVGDLALAYYAPILFLYQRCCLPGGPTGDGQELAGRLLDRHIRFFLEQYGNPERSEAGSACGAAPSCGKAKEQSAKDEVK